VSDSGFDDLFGSADDDDLDLPSQDGPDLFGLEPDELIVTHEPPSVVDLDLDLDEDTFDEIPIDPDDPATAASASEPVSLLPPSRPSTPQSRPEAPLALYRRYRPDTFADVIGQDHVTDPLRRALLNNRVNHAYLFSGPRGCGKTTSARILARCLNCDEGPTPTPCGVCQSCRDLARGGPGSIDVIEMDAATHGLVDDARDLRERAFFSPVHSRYKIYIIDEAHQVTNAGFNALLKLVEEPPPHVKFIFATTEPEKVLGTIRSRTHHYPFRLVPPKVLAGYLEQLCTAEGVAVDKAVLPLVVRAGAGSVRDSLSVLDQLLGGAAEGGVSYRQATALLGYTPDTLLDEIMDAFAAGDAEGVFACIDKVIEVGQDPRRFAEDLLRRLRDLIIVAAVPDALTSGLVEVSGDQAERLTTQASGMGPGELTRAAEVIAKGLTEMRGTTAPRLHLELMCARVLLPGADVDARGVHARLDRLERRLSMVGEGSLPAGPRAAEQASGRRPAAPTTDASPRDPVAPAGRPEAHRDAPEPYGSAPQSERPQPDTGRPEPRQAQPGRPQGDAADPAAQRPTAARPASERPADDWPDARLPQPAAPQPSGPRPTAADTAVTPQPQADQAPAASGDPGSLTTADVRRMWPQVLDAVKGRRRVTWIVLSQNAQVHSFVNNVLTIALNNAGARETFGRGGSPDILRESLIEVLGIAPTIETIVDGGGPTPDAAPSRPQPDAAAAAPAPYRRDERDEPPPEDDEPHPPEPSAPPAPSPAALAKEKIRKTQLSPQPPEDEVEQTRDDVDLDSSDLDVEGLLAQELGAELIFEDPQP